MTGALPAPDDLMEIGGGADLSPWMGDSGLDPSTMQGALPPPSALSPETRKILMEQIQRLSAPREQKRNLWTDPGFLAGMTLLGRGNMGQAAMAAAQAQARQDQTNELGETRRATALASLTGQLSRGDQMAAMMGAKTTAAQQKALAGALSLVAPTQRGVLYKAINEKQIDPTNLGAVYDFIGQNGLKLAPSLKAVAGVGLVDTSGEQPKVIVPVQHAPNAPPSAVAEYEYARKQGFTGTLLDFEREKAKRSGGDGTFKGSGMDPQSANLILSGDPMSPEYEIAYLTLYGPRQIQQADGTVVVMQPPVPQGIPKPGTPRQGAQTAPQAIPAPPMPSGQSPAGQLPASPSGAPASATTALPGGGSVTRVGEPRLSPADKAKVDNVISNAATISNALEDFAKAYEGAGPGERVSSVLGATTNLNTAYNKAALLAKSEELFNLGVLNGPDLDIIRRTLPDPSTIKGQYSGPEAARAATESVRVLLQDRLNAAMKQRGLPPIDLVQYGKTLRPRDGAKTGDPAKEGRFSSMGAGDLLKVDPKTLSPDELAQWRAASDRFAQ